MEQINAVITGVGGYVPDYILDKHYRRKHGPHAYYGQTREENA